jgi:hypothetical protein
MLIEREGRLPDCIDRVLMERGAFCKPRAMNKEQTSAIFGQVH